MKSKTTVRRAPRKKAAAPEKGEGASERALADAGQVCDAPSEQAGPPAVASEEAAGFATTPLDYMLGVMRDPTVESERRDEMAKLALPYMHPKVSAPDGGGGKQAMPAEPSELSEIDLARRVAFMMALAGRDDSGRHSSERIQATTADTN